MVAIVNKARYVAAVSDPGFAPTTSTLLHNSNWEQLHRTCIAIGVRGSAAYESTSLLTPVAKSSVSQDETHTLAGRKFVSLRVKRHPRQLKRCI